MDRTHDRDRGLGLALVLTFAGGWSCGSSGPPAGAEVKVAQAIESTEAAEARVEAIRARFLLPSAPAGDHEPGSPRSAATRRSVLGASIATSLELREGQVTAVLPAEARQGAARTANVSLPLHAGDPARLVDDSSGLAIRFALRGAGASTVASAGGVALYRGALAGADVVHRVSAEGTEDYVVFEDRPGREELAYDVDVSRVAGLRLVSNTLELLDADGAPRLRVAPPYVVDARAEVTAGTLAIEGCAFDASPRAPRGRAVTPPGASSCTLHVAWSAATYPAIVDPSWTATGSMATARLNHTASLLVSGDVLVVGGSAGHKSLASAELYDPTSGTFAATGSLTTARDDQTATVLDNNLVLISGGETGGKAQSSTEVYDSSLGTFTGSGAMTSARTLHRATLLTTGLVLISGGEAGGVLSSAELYDPSTGSSTATGGMVTARARHTATRLSTGEVLVTGGISGGATAELYDPTSGTFTATGSMYTARFYHAAVRLLGGDVLVTGGTSGAELLHSAEVYDPKKGKFSKTGGMKHTLYFHTATLLGSGDVLVAGGVADDYYDATASSELYDQTTGTFASASPMKTPRSNHTATVLPSGSVLVTGGDGSSVLAKAELYTQP